MNWKVMNTGADGWDPSNVEFAFFAGAKMYRSQPMRLKASVASGEITGLVADLIAPRAEGKFTTIWNLRRGNETFCRVRLTIYVP